MSFREEQKKQREKVSNTLMDAALELAAKEGYASLSLRSVARAAGIAPTSFYRHFRDMDELGVALVDKARDLLEDIVEQAGKDMAPQGKDKGEQSPSSLALSMAGPFVDRLFTIFKEEKSLLRLFFQERTGSSEALREAIGSAWRRLNRDLSREMGFCARTAGLDLGEAEAASETLLVLASGFGMEEATKSGGKMDRAREKALEVSRLYLTARLADA